MVTSPLPLIATKITRNISGKAKVKAATAGYAELLLFPAHSTGQRHHPGA